MFGATLVACLAIAATPAPVPGDTLEAGLYPALVLIRACESIDRLPGVLEHPRLGDLPVRLHVDLPILERTLPSLVILLGASGLHRIEYIDDNGKAFAFVTSNPRKLPTSETHYAVAVIELRHADAIAAAEALNRAAEEKEEALPDEEVRTLFVAVPASRRMVVRYASEARLREYLDRLEELDAAPAPRPEDVVLRTWLCRFRRVDDLAEEFAKEWKRAGKSELDPVASMSTNALLFRLPRAEWAEVEKLLERLDRMEIERKGQVR